jgi:hypothetical protein
MVSVLRSICDDHYDPYPFDSPEAIFLAIGDLHDTSYGCMEVDTELPRLMQQISRILPVRFLIYPSKMMTSAKEMK